MSLWVLEFLLMKNSWDKKPPTPDKKPPQNPKKQNERMFAQNLHVSSEYYLNTIISLYFKCLVFKHYY